MTMRGEIIAIRKKTFTALLHGDLEIISDFDFEDFDKKYLFEGSRFTIRDSGDLVFDEPYIWQAGDFEKADELRKELF